MRFIMIFVLAVTLTGCGGSGAKDTAPSSPNTQDNGKKPPSIPDIS